MKLAAIGTAVADWVAEHPMSLPGRIAALRFGIPRAPLPGVLRADDSPLRVLMAPANYAGQATEWCRSIMRDRTDVSARNFALASPFGFAADVVVPPAVFHNSTRWQRDQLAAARGFSHFLIESFIPPFGRLYGRDLDRQLNALGDTEVALMCHGSDVRRPSRNRERTPWAPVLDETTMRRLEKFAMRNLEVVARSDRPVFVSTPDLIEDVPRAAWCPVVVEWERWSLPRVRRDGPVRVVHAPSKADVKGSRFIEPVLLRLAARGAIDYHPIRGVPHERMPEVLASADIVVDQIGTGSYGVAACEAMASGSVVVSHVTERTRSTVAELTGRALPIVEANPDSLEQVVTALAADADERERVGAAAPEFVRAVHDGRRSASILVSHWVDAG